MEVHPNSNSHSTFSDRSSSTKHTFSRSRASTLKQSDRVINTGNATGTLTVRQNWLNSIIDQISKKDFLPSEQDIELSLKWKLYKLKKKARDTATGTNKKQRITDLTDINAVGEEEDTSELSGSGSVISFGSHFSGSSTSSTNRPLPQPDGPSSSLLQALQHSQHTSDSFAVGTSSSDDGHPSVGSEQSSSCTETSDTTITGGGGEILPDDFPQFLLASQGCAVGPSTVINSGAGGCFLLPPTPQPVGYEFASQAVAALSAEPCNEAEDGLHASHDDDNDSISRICNSTNLANKLGSIKAPMTATKQLQRERAEKLKKEHKRGPAGCCIPTLQERPKKVKVKAVGRSTMTATQKLERYLQENTLDAHHTADGPQQLTEEDLEKERKLDVYERLFMHTHRKKTNNNNWKPPLDQLVHRDIVKDCIPNTITPILVLQQKESVRNNKSNRPMHCKSHTMLNVSKPPPNLQNNITVNTPLDMSIMQKYDLVNNSNVDIQNQLVDKPHHVYKPFSFQCSIDSSAASAKRRSSSAVVAEEVTLIRKPKATSHCVPKTVPRTRKSGVRITGP